jgi:membrane associated rhomboid family serine protease
VKTTESSDAQHPVRPAILILKVGVLAAALATIVSALLVAVLSAVGPPLSDTTSPSILDITKTTILLFPITAVSYGSFGLLAGIIGSATLVVRRRRIRSRRRLLVEASIMGFLLGFLFPFFDRLLNRYVNPVHVLFSAPVGTFCALLCALFFRRHFLNGYSRQVTPC